MIIGFSASKTEDSTCHLRDSKEDYLYHTILGFHKHVCKYQSAYSKR